MSRKSESAPAVVTGTFPDGAFPAVTRRKGHGARGVRSEPVSHVPTFTAAHAAVVCPKFPAGGEAFERWLREAHPTVRTDQPRPMSDWEPLLEEFAKRPILGHRRRQGSPSHRVR